MTTDVTASPTAGPATPDARGADAPPDASPPYRWRWLALFIVLAAEIMDLLDSTIVGIAAPSIRADLGGSLTSLQWFGAGYTLAFAVGLITGARLGDLYGRKRMFLVGAAGFTIASLLCGIAQSADLLVAFRILQGLFGAALIPQGFGIIKAIFPPKELAAAFGMFGPVMGLAAVGGPILAGALIDGDLFGTGWRMIFLINLPVGLFALLGGAKFLPESRSEHASRLDLVGMLLVTLGSVLLIYPLVQGRELGWPGWAFGSMIAAVPVLAAFAWYQVRLHRRGGSPLVVPGLFRTRGYSAGLVVGLVFFSAMSGLMLAFGLFTQLGLGYSPLHAGLTMVPMSLGIAVGAGLAGGLLAPKFGRKVLHAGVAIMALGVLGIWLTLELTGAGVTTWQFVPALLVSGLGMGLLIAPFFDIALAAVDGETVGSASGVLNANQQLGTTLGVAVLGTIFFSLVESGSRTGAASTAFITATQDVLLISAGLLAVTFLVAFLLPKRARE